MLSDSDNVQQYLILLFHSLIEKTFLAWLCMSIDTLHLQAQNFCKIPMFPSLFDAYNLVWLISKLCPHSMRKM